VVHLLPLPVVARQQGQVREAGLLLLLMESCTGKLLKYQRQLHQ
jgi:hypothetical protein